MDLDDTPPKVNGPTVHLTHLFSPLLHLLVFLSHPNRSVAAFLSSRFPFFFWKNFLSLSNFHRLHSSSLILSFSIAAKAHMRALRLRQLSSAFLLHGSTQAAPPAGPCTLARPALLADVHVHGLTGAHALCLHLDVASALRLTIALEQPRRPAPGQKSPGPRGVRGSQRKLPISSFTSRLPSV
jgi:hypothetical protein